MTDRPTNPLVSGQAVTRRKATVDDLYACAADLNANLDVQKLGWHFVVVPNDDGKMCVRRIEPGLSHDRQCTPEQAEAIMREFGLKSNPLAKAA